MTKILLVEDEVIIYRGLEKYLRAQGFEVDEYTPDYDQAVHRIAKGSPDLVIIDIELLGALNGLDVADYLANNYKIPFMFLTVHDSDAVMAEAKQLFPRAYQLKDKGTVGRKQLLANIRMALSEGIQHKRGLMIYDADSKDRRVRIDFDSIVWIESSGNYVYIHVPKDGTEKHQEKFSVFKHRSTLADMSKVLPESFMRIHKQHIVNCEKIIGSDKQDILIMAGETPLSIGDSYRDTVRSYLHKHFIGMKSH